MNISRIGIDLAKNVFQLHGVDRRGKVVWKRRLKRDQWLKAVMDHAEPGCEIGIEACGGAQIYASCRPYVYLAEFTFYTASPSSRKVCLMCSDSSQEKAFKIASSALGLFFL